MNTNICILGYSNSGKTTFVNKILGFNSDNLSSTKNKNFLGVELSSNELIYKNKNFQWKIWDSGNFTTYFYLLNRYIKKSHIFLIFLDLSKSIIDQDIECCIDKVKELQDNPHIILVCSKADLESKVCEFDILNITKKYEIKFFKISNKDNSYNLLKNYINEYFYKNNLNFEYNYENEIIIKSKFLYN